MRNCAVHEMQFERGWRYSTEQVHEKIQTGNMNIIIIFYVLVLAGQWTRRNGGRVRVSEQIEKIFSFISKEKCGKCGVEHCDWTVLEISNDLMDNQTVCCHRFVRPTDQCDRLSPLTTVRRRTSRATTLCANRLNLRQAVKTTAELLGEKMHSAE